MDARVKKLLHFLQEIEQLHSIKRIIHYEDGSQENSAEHSWHVAMFAMLLGPEVDPKADVSKMVKMSLIHDVIEIYAGDTFLFDDNARVDKEKRERQAAEKLFSQLPDDRQVEFWELFEEFEALETPEAKIVKSFDHIQPLVHNLIHDGSTWRRHGVTSKMHDDKKRPQMKHNQEVLRIYEALHAEALKRRLFADN